jgi:hypothetical protein
MTAALNAASMLAMTSFFTCDLRCSSTADDPPALDCVSNPGDCRWLLRLVLDAAAPRRALRAVATFASLQAASLRLGPAHLVVSLKNWCASQHTVDQGFSFA